MSAQLIVNPMDLYPHHIATWSRDAFEGAVRSEVRTVYLGSERTLARILGRHKIFLQTVDHGFACHLMIDGFWESWVTQFLAREVRPGMNVVDVGANFGYFTLLLADLVGETGTVLAVEPNPDAAASIRESIMLNGFAARTRVSACALGDAPGSALLFLPHHEPKNASIVDNADSPGGRTIETPVRTLDELAGDGPRIDLVKIDAEGSEPRIWAGMRNIVRRDRPRLLLEFNARRCAEPRALLDDLMAIYGPPRELSGDSELTPFDADSATTTDESRDHMLYFQ
jgi:FkbM family methyltransferase